MSVNPSAQNLVAVYFAYATASVALTIWLARTLSKSGEVFLDDVFVDNPRMAPAVNRLLVVGFYLLNLGYAFVTLKAGVDSLTPVQRFSHLPVGARRLPRMVVSPRRPRLRAPRRALLFGPLAPPARTRIPVRARMQRRQLRARGLALIGA